MSFGNLRLSNPTNHLSKTYLARRGHLILFFIFSIFSVLVVLSLTFRTPKPYRKTGSSQSPYYVRGAKSVMS